MDAENSAFFGISDQSAFGGRFSLNLWAREAKPWAHLRSRSYPLYLYRLLHWRAHRSIAGVINVFPFESTTVDEASERVVGKPETEFGS